MRRLVWLAATTVVVLASIAAGILLNAAVLDPLLSEPDPTPTPTVTPTATSTATPTDTPMPTNTPTPTLTNTPAPTATSAPPPTPTPIRGGDLSGLPLPAGTTIVRTGCASDGRCEWFNFWWHPTSEAVMQPGEPRLREVHELCHGHQDWSIGRSLAPSEHDLAPWYETAEGRAWSAAFPTIIWSGVSTRDSLLEDFAHSCAYYYVDPGELYRVSPTRYGWFEERFR